MLKFGRPSNKQRYEKILDFGREVDTLDIECYYIFEIDLACRQMLHLYVEYKEQVTKIFLFTKYSTEWFIKHMTFDVKKVDGRIYITNEYMYNFDLVRVIPENGYRYFDSYLRVMVKEEIDRKFKPLELE
jgi:hypothetical protein